ncbi:MAG: helix-turn-helix domain-containing protein [Clostridia bacterium]|nr:helix-turn-helix domain-containing protein [Clostridia bacterium]MBR6604095.1 helix-turn-helix domain-containing protein [Clostridia bacterium]
MPELYRLPMEITNHKHVRILMNYPSDTTPVHMHEYVEIELVLKGKCKQLINGTIYDNIERGSLYLLTPVDFHQLLDFESRLEAINLCFDDSFYDSDIVQLFMNKSSNIVLKLNAEELATAQKMIEQVRESCASDDKYAMRYTRNVLECFLIYILRQSESKSTEVFDAKLTPIQKALEYLFQHYRESPTSEQMAKICGYSESHFCRQFKNLTQKTYVEFLNTLKLNYAKVLLLSDKLPIIEVADICGFNSVSNFNRVFKQQLGIPPSDFIKQNQSKQKKKEKI